MDNVSTEWAKLALINSATNNNQPNLSDFRITEDDEQRMTQDSIERVTEGSA